MPATLWSKTAIAAPERPALEGELCADVCIVGAGVSGVAAACFLASGGASVVLVEADRIGSGAVGKSSGFVNAGLWVPPSEIVAAIGETHGRRLIDTLGDAPRRVFELIGRLGLECDAENRGTLQCAPDAAAFDDLKARLAGWIGKPGDLTLADAEETARLTGSTLYRGALVDRRAGVLQPLSYVRALAQAAERAGAFVFETSLAQGFERVRERWRVTTPRGVVTAKWLLVTTEAHMIGTRFGLAREYVPMPFFNVATRRLTADERAAVMPAGQPIVDLRKVVSACRFDAAGRLVIGSIGEVTGPDGAINRRWALRKTGRLFLALRDVGIEHAWAGRIGVTGNHMPTVHAIGENAYALGGYNGRGIAAGTVFAEEISRVILGMLDEQDLPVPVTRPEKARLPAVRGTLLRAGAAAFHLADARRRPAAISGAPPRPPRA